MESKKVKKEHTQFWNKQNRIWGGKKLISHGPNTRLNTT